MVARWGSGGLGETGNQGGIWVGNVDGSGALRVGSDPNPTLPSWSPDGAFILYVQSNDIYVMNAGGGTIGALVERPGVDRYPVWSPDGRKVAFEGAVGTDQQHIFVVNSDGTGLIDLSARGERAAFDNREPAWSPAGTLLLFGSAVPGTLDFEMYVMDADGRNVRKLTDLRTRVRHPDWRRAR